MHYITFRFLIYLAPLIVIKGHSATDTLNVLFARTTAAPANNSQKLPACTTATNNDAEPSSVQAVYVTTPSNEEDISEKYPVLKEPEENSVKIPLGRSKRPRRKWAAEKLSSQSEKILVPQNVTFDLGNTDWTQRIFERGQELANHGTDKPGPLISHHVTTERTRTRYGWRIRKRNKKVLTGNKDSGDFSEEPKLDEAKHSLDQSVLEHDSATSMSTEEFPRPKKIRRMYSARFRHPDNLTTTDASPAASNNEEIGEESVDKVPSEDKQAEEVAEAKETNDKKEEGTGGQQGSEEHTAHNEKGSKGYENHEKEEKAKQGHKDTESHTGEYDDEKKSKTEHHDDDGHYHAEDDEEGGKKGANHEEHESYKKGHSTHGGHVIHKKDEYEKKTEFFDEDDDDGHGEKFGEYHEEHEGEKGGNHKKGHYDSALDESHKNNKGHFEKSSHHGHDNNKEQKEGHDSFYDNEMSYGQKHGHKTQNTYSNAPQKSGHLVRGEGQVAIRTMGHNFPMQRRGESHESEETDHDDGHESDDNNDTKDTAQMIGGEGGEESDDTNDTEDTAQIIQGEESYEDPNEEYQEDDSSSEPNSQDDNMSETDQKVFMKDMFRRYPHAQFLNMDGPTQREYFSLTTTPPPQYTTDFVPFRQAYQMTYRPPKTTQPPKQNNPESQHRNLPFIINYPNYVPNSQADFPTTRRTLPENPVMSNLATSLPDRTSFEVLDMRRNNWKPLGFSITADISPRPNQRSRRYPAEQSNTQSIDSYKVNTAYYPVSIKTGPA